MANGITRETFATRSTDGKLSILFDILMENHKLQQRNEYRLAMLERCQYWLTGGIAVGAFSIGVLFSIVFGG